MGWSILGNTQYSRRRTQGSLQKAPCLTEQWYWRCDESSWDWLVMIEYVDMPHEWIRNGWWTESLRMAWVTIWTSKELKNEGVHAVQDQASLPPKRYSYHGQLLYNPIDICVFEHDRTFYGMRVVWSVGGFVFDALYSSSWVDIGIATHKTEISIALKTPWSRMKEDSLWFAHEWESAAGRWQVDGIH